MSRRAFFRSVAGDAMDAAEGLSRESGVWAPGSHSVATEAPLGSVHDFPLGESRSVRRGSMDFEVRASADGISVLRLEPMSRTPLAVRMDSQGNLWVLLDQKCDEREVFCLFTCRMKLP